MGDKTEVPSSPDLMTSREPVGPATDKSNTIGAVAVNDALIIITLAWATLFFLAYSLRAHNI
jgi:hypothetical protein